MPDQDPLSLFKHYPARPSGQPAQNGYTILCNAHDAASSFLDTFSKVRKARKARGAPTDEEQDLLRACLVFAGAGLDSMAKQLIRDALPIVIDRVPGAEDNFKQHIARHTLRQADGDAAMNKLAEILADRNPRQTLIEHLIRDLTAGSLQSAEEVMRVASYFDIPSTVLQMDMKRMQAIFGARNQIVHEMDVNFSQVNRNRRSRTRADMTSHTNEVFRVASVLLSEVDLRAREP